jgi:hypothetical protein
LAVGTKAADTRAAISHIARWANRAMVDLLVVSTVFGCVCLTKLSHKDTTEHDVPREIDDRQEPQKVRHLWVVRSLRRIRVPILKWNTIFNQLAVPPILQFRCRFWQCVLRETTSSRTFVSFGNWSPCPPTAHNT